MAWHYMYHQCTAIVLSYKRVYKRASVGYFPPRLLVLLHAPIALAINNGRREKGEKLFRERERYMRAREGERKKESEREREQERTDTLSISFLLYSPAIIWSSSPPSTPTLSDGSGRKRLRKELFTLRKVLLVYSFSL